MKNLNFRATAATIFFLALFTLVGMTPCLAGQEENKQKELIETASNCVIAVFRGGEQIATAGAELLTKLESVALNLPGVKKTQNGPRLVDLLAALDLKDYKKITIHGFAKGRVATAEYTISRDKLHDRIIFSFSRRGTAKLVVPELTFDDWIVDVNKLEIE